MGFIIKNNKIINYIEDDDIATYKVPAQVTKTGNCAFAFCKKLTEITLHNSITEIAHKAFEECVKLKEIVIPESVGKISSDAFKKSLHIWSYIQETGYER